MSRLSTSCYSVPSPTVLVALALFAAATVATPLAFAENSPGFGGPPGNNPSGANGGHRPGMGFRKEIMDYCRANPTDERCVQLRERMKAHREQMKQLCDANPNDEKCVRRRERMQRWQQNGGFGGERP